MSKEIEDYLNSLAPDEQEKFLKSAVELKQKFDLRDKAKRSILESDNYILWLTSFTKEHPHFSTDDWLYTPNLITREDEKNVFDLELLFEIVAEYAKKNYIDIVSTKWGGFYLIKFNDVGFKIEVASGQGTVFACKRIDSNIDPFLDFKSIQIDEELPDTYKRYGKLKSLSDLVKDISKEVPIEFIKQEFNNTIKSIKGTEEKI